MEEITRRKLLVGGIAAFTVFAVSQSTDENIQKHKSKNTLIRDLERRVLGEIEKPGIYEYSTKYGYCRVIVENLNSSLVLNSVENYHNSSDTILKFEKRVISPDLSFFENQINKVVFQGREHDVGSLSLSELEYFRERYTEILLIVHLKNKLKYGK